MKHKKWLNDLADLLAQNPDAQLYYTTDDDGVWLRYGTDRGQSINLGLYCEEAVEALRAAAGG